MDTEKSLQAAFAHLPVGGRVVVAMSGGVDSSVAAALVKQQGFETIGITLQLYDHGLALQKKGACCAGQDIYDAKQVAAKLDIPHYVLNYENRFQEKVIDDFVDSYMQGRTPVPCIRCNQRVKFQDLLQSARQFGACAMVTGHYVRKQQQDDGPAYLLSAQDEGRDQSYFLFATTQEQLDFLEFPLGAIPKTQTRLIAEQMGLHLSEKPDSQDICFVPQGRYSDIVAKQRPEAIQPGEIIHIDGRVMGQHKGIIHYTVGQRRGLGIAAGEPLFVLALDADKRRVYVGEREHLAVRSFTITDTNWLAKPRAQETVFVKVRSTRPPIPAQVVCHADGQGATVTLLADEYGVSPGQAAVFYQEPLSPRRLLGGGWIENTAMPNALMQAMKTESQQSVDPVCQTAH